MAWTRFFQAIVLMSSVCPMCILAGVPRSQSSDSKDLAPKPTGAGVEFDVHILIPTTVKPRRFNKKRICCQIGRTAARKGYTCYLRRNIALIRLNMPQRYVMKMTINSKWGYSFARRMESCAKTHRLTRKFNHCCNKEALVMDKVRSLP